MKKPSIQDLTPFLVVAAVVVAVLISLFAASSTVLSRSPGGASEIAARLDDRVISLAEVDARWQRENPVEYSETMDRLYDQRRMALTKVVGDILVDAAAGRRGMTREQLLDVEMAQRMEPVTANDVMAFYAANVEALGGGPLEQHRGRIDEALNRRARDRAYAALVSELASSVRSTDVLLEPLRQFPPVNDTDPSLGNPEAAVTVVVYSDFQCPFCARVEPTLKQLQARYGDKVRIVWKDFPLMTIHPDAFMAAEASHCAAEQGRYVEYHDRLFAHQDRIGLAGLKSSAAELGLDPGTFSSCLASSRYAARVQESLEAGRRIGVESTPTVFVNGRAVRGAHPVGVFAELIDEELDRSRAAQVRR